MSSDEPKPGQTAKDGCPPWAETVIAEIRSIEIKLGNIPNTLAWISTHAENVYKRLYGSDALDQVHSEKQVEEMFIRLVHRLTDAGFTPDDIVRFVNTRIGYKGGPPYCNTAEIEEALSDK